MIYADRVDSKGPKKLLALDGGGIRGVLSIEILGAIEDLVRAKEGPDATLSDYFDYIGGTSTGAIIAAGLARGMSVSEIRTIYHKHGKEMFDKAFILDRFRYGYRSGRLTSLLKRTFGADSTFGDEDTKTLLMVMMRNATTDSPWPLSNNPRAKYNARTRDDCNLDIPLWQLVRASTAAPTYFPPERIEFGDRSFVFVDGGVTMYNNPAFQLFLMATTGAYRLGWDTGEDNMLLVSVGTGTAPKEDDTLRPESMNLLYNAKSIPAALMSAAQAEQDLLCRIFGRCRNGAMIDREVGSQMGGGDPFVPGVDEPGLSGPRMFSYVRYNAELTREGLDDLDLPGVQPEHVQKLDSVEHTNELQQVGQRVAERQVTAAHFENFI